MIPLGIRVHIFFYSIIFPGIRYNIQASGKSFRFVAINNGFSIMLKLEFSALKHIE